MTKSVTSTSVATNGAELVAGSKPTLFKMKGNMLPETEPILTTPMSVSQTVALTGVVVAIHRLLGKMLVCFAKYANSLRRFGAIRDQEVGGSNPLSPTVYLLAECK